MFTQIYKDVRRLDYTNFYKIFFKRFFHLEIILKCCKIRSLCLINLFSMFTQIYKDIELS
jgi:hypothetical protein